MSKIARVFPAKTSVCPKDELAFFGEPPLFLPDDLTEVHVSCTFTWDIPRAEQLAKNWEAMTGIRVQLGGPAYGEPGGEFTPGMYLKFGYTITSRGCPNRCWFCSVWRREGSLRELEIKPGWEILDDNLLACSESHIKAVFKMLSKNHHAPIFSGGLEARLLKPWHVELLANAHPNAIYFAYDTPDDKEPLYEAGKLLKEVWEHPENRCYAYVLFGYEGDTLELAEERMRFAFSCGFLPFGMLYQDGKTKSRKWSDFQRKFARPQITRAICSGKTAVSA